MDYKLFSKDERLQYLRSQKMTTGIPYFGGKANIGKYIYNTIFNMAITMHDNGDKPKTFIDCFTGGGKIGLSLPDGWCERIVLNDYDYGVFSYYKSCKSDYRKLLATVDGLVDKMTKQFFEKCLAIRENEELDQFIAGAMTYVCSACSFNNILNIEKAEYRPSMGDNNEKEELEKVKARAHKAITKVAKQLKNRNYVIENLSYEQVIAKYNGLNYFDKHGVEHKSTESKDDGNNILWYFDPPYHPYCLNGMKEAPYANSFNYEDTIKMTKILAGEIKDYGEIKYFIKSDYNPKVTSNNAKRTLEEFKEQGNKTATKSKDSEKSKDSDVSKSTFKEKLKKQCQAIMEHYDEMQHDFDSIEDTEKGFLCLCVGGFDKGVLAKDENNRLFKTVGEEYIWCRGLPNGYEDIEKVV